jgi:CRISPR-associated protein Cas2
METVRKNKPSKGLVQMLVITEKQYARMEYVVGEFHSDIIDSDERTVFL